MVIIRFWCILRKRLWLVILLLALVAITYIISYRPPQPVFVASMRFTVGIKPEPFLGTYYTYDRYYTWLTAEYLLDDLAEVVKSSAFAQDVAAVSGVAVPPAAIQGATSTGKLHRILSVSLSWPNKSELEVIATAIPQVLQDNQRYFSQMGTENAVITTIDPPTISVADKSLRERLDLPLRLIIALAAGILLAFLLDYVDTSIRDREDAKALGIPILGEIPVKRSVWAFLPRRRIP